MANYWELLSFCYSIDARSLLVGKLELHVHHASIKPLLHRASPSDVFRRHAQVHFALARQNATVTVVVDWKVEI